MQASLVGQACFLPGQAQATFSAGGSGGGGGGGCAVLFHTGSRPALSEQGLLTTVAYQLGPRRAPAYALEGSAASAGAALSWLRDRLGVARDTEEVFRLAAEAGDSRDVYMVPAFSGLHAPRWRPDARGTVCGLTAAAGREHLCRAALEALAFQTREVLEAM